MFLWGYRGGGACIHRCRDMRLRLWLNLSSFVKAMSSDVRTISLSVHDAFQYCGHMFMVSAVPPLSISPLFVFAICCPRFANCSSCPPSVAMPPSTFHPAHPVGARTSNESRAVVAQRCDNMAMPRGLGQALRGKSPPRRRRRHHHRHHRGRRCRRRRCRCCRGSTGKTPPTSCGSLRCTWRQGAAKALRRRCGRNLQICQTLDVGNNLVVSASMVTQKQCLGQISQVWGNPRQE